MVEEVVVEEFSCRLFVLIFVVTLYRSWLWHAAGDDTAASTYMPPWQAVNSEVCAILLDSLGSTLLLVNQLAGCC